MKIILDHMPKTLEDMKTMTAADLSRPEYAPVLFLCAMCVYPENREEAFRMVEYLRGPNGLSEFERQFLSDRMREADYVPRSFFEGALPSNNYTPDLPYTVNVEETPYSYDNEGYARLWLQSGGADSPRQCDMRLKKSTGQWFLNQQMLLGGIRIPAEQDPWA